MSLLRSRCSISFWLREYPWRSNAFIGVTIGLCADVTAQAVAGSLCSPKNNALKSRNFLVVKCPYFFHMLLVRLGFGDAALVPIIDLRRSFIFSTFTLVFGTSFFLLLYRRLDVVFPPATITRCQSIVKGFLFWIAVNTTMPLYFFYVATLSHYFIHCTGCCRLSEADGGEFGWVVDFSTFWEGVMKQVRRQVREDWPDMIQYSFAFWGLNWIPMFYYIPSHFRFLYGSTLQILWGTIASYLMHRGVATV